MTEYHIGNILPPTPKISAITPKERNFNSKILSKCRDILPLPLAKLSLGKEQCLQPFPAASLSRKPGEFDRWLKSTYLFTIKETKGSSKTSPGYFFFLNEGKNVKAAKDPSMTQKEGQLKGRDI